MLVISFSHPGFTTPDCSWVRDESGRKLHWKVDRYFSEGPFEAPVSPDDEVPLIRFHRTLAEYLRAFRESGLMIMDLVEPSPSEEMLVTYPGSRDDYRMCHFMVVKALKRPPVESETRAIG